MTRPWQQNGWFKISRGATKYATGSAPGFKPGNGGGGKAAPDPTSSRSGSKKMVIKPTGQVNGIEVPYAPREITMANLADTYTEVSRVGQAPLVVRESESVNRMSFSLFLGTLDFDESVAPLITKLESYAQMEAPLKVNYSSMEDGEWHISSMSVSTVNRRPSDHEVTQATIEIEFVRSTGGADGVGPVSGGVGKGKGKNKDEGGNVVIYTVKAGDTLHSIAVKFFKDAERWKDIAKWNDITKKPKDELKVGRKLELRTKKAVAKGGR